MADVEHWMTQTFTYDDGLTRRHEHHIVGHCTAAEAQRQRTTRLRDGNLPFTQGPGWVKYREEPPRHVEPVTVLLTWSDVAPTEDNR